MVTMIGLSDGSPPETWKKRVMEANLATEGCKRALVAKTELEVLEKPSRETVWQFLEAKSAENTSQLFIAGTRIRASTVWGTTRANGLTPEQAADARGIPIQAVLEAISYCEQNRALLIEEATRDKVQLIAGGFIAAT